MPTQSFPSPIAFSISLSSPPLCLSLSLDDRTSGSSFSPLGDSSRSPLDSRGVRREEEREVSQQKSRFAFLSPSSTSSQPQGRKNSKMPPLYLLRNAGAPLWAPPGSVGVVTGANKGIGLEIAAGLAANGLAVVSAARSEERGRAAVEAIRARASPETKAVVSFLQLDVASDASVSEFAKKLRGVAPAGGK